MKDKTTKDAIKKTDTTTEKYVTKFEPKTSSQPLPLGTVFVVGDRPYLRAGDTNIFSAGYAVDMISGRIYDYCDFENKTKEIIHVKIVQV